MPEQKSVVKVGFFVLIGVAVLITSVLMLGQNQMIFRDRYILKAEFKQVQGLVEGSLVSLAGVPVGNISHLEISPTNPTVVVVMRLDRTYQNKITENSLASIKTQGALGDKYIYITQPGEGTPVKEGEFVPADSQPDLFDALSEKSSQFASVGDLLKELTVLLQNMNAQNRSALLVENISNASKNLSTLSSDPNLKKSFARFESILEKIDQGDGTLGRLINDPALHEKILELLGEPSRNRYLKPLIKESIRRSQEASADSR